MKNLGILAFLFICSLNLQAQKIIECSERESCFWSDVTKEKVNCNREAELSTFTFKNNETEIVHSTPSMTSSYFVKSSVKMGKVRFYAVESDAGNLYTFAVNEKKKELKILTYKNIVITFKVKKVSK